MNRVTLALAATLAATGATAATRQATLAGSSLAVDTPCARQVDITPDPALHARITVQADALHQEELDRLVMEDGVTARIRTRRGGCWQAEDGQFRPTLALTIHVPPALALAVAESGAGRYAIGPVGGALTVELSGVADISAADVVRLTVDLSGSGKIAIDQVEGPATVDISGHGTVQVGHAAMPHAAVALSGVGDFTIGSGQVGSVTVENSGVGHVGIGAAVGNAKVEMSGAGSIHFSSISGTLQKDVSGLGDVSVGK